MATKLCEQSLSSLGSNVTVPDYDRKELKAGILHFGISNFFRSHFATYLDDLFHSGTDLDWAVAGASVTPNGRAKHSLLESQDFLYTVVEQDECRTEARVVGALVDYLPPGDLAAIVDRLADPAIRIVSLTITKGCYFVDPATGGFHASHPAMVADAAQPEAPKTVFGLIVAGMRRRMENGIAPFTLLSCDNLHQNGAVMRQTVLGLASLICPTLSKWIAANAGFPNCIVDRITPATSAQHVSQCAAQFGVADASPVFCETYRQWVIEDNFPAGRPALEKVGVQFVPDVRPYEKMKIRVLNGGHVVLSSVGGMLGIRHVHEAMRHPLVRAFFTKLMLDEVLPVVGPIPGTDIRRYLRLVVRRFANPNIADPLSRLYANGSTRHPHFLHPTVRDRLKRELSVDGLALVSALWCHLCAGRNARGEAVDVQDPEAELLKNQAKLARLEPTEWLRMEAIYGDLAESAEFQTKFCAAMNAVCASGGVQKALASYVVGGLDENSEESRQRQQFSLTKVQRERTPLAVRSM